MGIKVYGLFSSQDTNNQHTVEVNGNTIGECLKHLQEKFPSLNLLDKDGKLLAYLGIYIKGEIVFPPELDKPVNDGDELSIVPMIDGG